MHWHKSPNFVVSSFNMAKEALNKKHNRGGSVCNVKILINSSNTRYLQCNFKQEKKPNTNTIKFKINGFVEPITLIGFAGSNDQLTRM